MVLRPVEVFKGEYEAESTVGEVAQAAWELGAEDRPLKAAARLGTAAITAEVGEKLPKDELNKQYPGLNTQEDMTEMHAAYIHGAKEERQEREEVIANTDGFLKGIAIPFITRAASSMLDPTTFLGGMLTSKIAAGTATRLGIKSTAGRYGVAVTENILANIPEEAVVYAADNAQLMDYTATQAAANAIGGGVFFPSLTFGVGALVKKLTKAAPAKLDPIMNQSNSAMVLDQKLSDSIEPIMRHTENTMDDADSIIPPDIVEQSKTALNDEANIHGYEAADFESIDTMPKPLDTKALAADISRQNEELAEAFRMQGVTDDSPEMKLAIQENERMGAIDAMIKCREGGGL